MELKKTIKELPIPFSTDMVNALLKDQKDVTRRMSKELKKINQNPDSWNLIDMSIEKDIPIFHFKNGSKIVTTIKSRYGNIEDLLYVRESWAKVPSKAYRDVFSLPIDQQMSAIYKAGWTRGSFTWKSSMYLPKKASRIWIENVDIFPERLLSITEDESLREGISSWHNPLFNEERYRDYSGKQDWKQKSECRDPVRSFLTLWDRINPEFPSSINPWVFRLQFKIKSTEGYPK